MMPRDTHVTEPVEIERLTRQNRAVLARLQQGPASARELSSIALKYTSRISDLRAAGYDVQYREERGWYELVPPSPAEPTDAGHNLNSWTLR